MTDITGIWETTTQSPIGPQVATLTITGSNESFGGTSAGPMGSAEVSGGSVSGDTVTCTIKATAPFPMTMTLRATLTGDDAMEGEVDTGSFGKMAYKATRKG